MRFLSAVIAIAAAWPAVADQTSDYGKTQGAIPGILLGPKLNAVALPPGVGLEAKLLGNALGLSLDLGLVPKVTISNAQASWTDLSFGAKYYPWRARFYLGAAVGDRIFTASASDSAGKEAKADVSSFYLAPEIGWRFVWEGGFFLGIDLGYQIILSSSTTLTLPAGVDPTKQQNVTDAADKIGKIGLPVITLLQLGYFF